MEHRATNEGVSLRVNGRPVTVGGGTTVAAALLQTGVAGLRRSVTGAPRGPLCGMGVCFECRVTIDGVPQRLSCQTVCAAGMEVCTDGP
jgi:sarcosine oxidase subunit alpha